MINDSLPLLPLAYDRLPSSWLRMLGQEGVPIVARHDAGPTRFVLFDGRLSPPPTLRPDQQSIEVSLFEFDVNPISISAAVAPKTTHAFWQVGDIEAREEVAAVDHRTVRETLISRLRCAIQELGGVWMRTSPYPFPYQTAANFRFDHDRFIADDFYRMLDAVRGHEEMTSHYLCGSQYESQPEAVAALRDMDVGSHGYHHHTYRDARENRRNIQRGLDAIRRCGVDPVGFVAPHGRYNPALAEALQSLGVAHSSEFAAAYDDLPFTPEGSGVLQIPVHPVCLGIALDGKRERTDKQVVAAVGEYFEAAVTEKYAAREPLFFYGHPDGRVGRYPEVLRRWFSAVASRPGVWRTSLTQFARWWRERAACRWEVHGTADRPRLVVDRTPPSFAAAVEWVGPAGVASLPLTKGRLELSAEHTQFVPRTRTTRTRPVRLEPIRGLRHWAHRLLDWEYETPVKEIDAHHLRGRLKKSLRHWKEARA
ncbi:MAG: polysaccharide deacetylase family protein [Planctomycetes bacterium]|nr:polysaccharide deacetylase family protein [Planctomycetota bacterium]